MYSRLLVATHWARGNFEDSIFKCFSQAKCVSAETKLDQGAVFAGVKPTLGLADLRQFAAE